jgi:hypothetical protein
MLQPANQSKFHGSVLRSLPTVSAARAALKTANLSLLSAPNRGRTSGVATGVFAFGKARLCLFQRQARPSHATLPPLPIR